MSIIDRINAEHLHPVQRVQIVSKKIDGYDVFVAYLTRGSNLLIGSFAVTVFLDKLSVRMDMLTAAIGMCAVYYVVQFGRGK